VDIIAERIAGLPQETQRLFLLASCFGAEFHAFLLQELSDSDIHQALSMAEKELLIERIEVTSDVASLGVLQHFQAWRFAHDQIQQSAYSLVDESEREQTHLEIGRRLWNGLSEEHLKLFGFAVVRQIRMGACLIVDGAERLKAADLLLNAGVYASKTSAFDEAATYFELAISLLPPRHWRDEYFLSLRLYERAAQLAYCSGNHERVDDLTDEVFKNARENKHKLVAYISRIRSAATRDHAQEALDLAIKVLNENGFKVSRRSNMASIVYNVMKTKLMLGSRSDLQIRMNSRKQVDEAALHITTIVNIATTTSTVVDPHLFPILAMKGVQRALAEGVHGETAISFAAAALIMCCHIGDVELGLRLAKLALEIIEDTKAVEWQPQVALIVHAFVFPVQQPVANQLGPLLVAHRLGMKYGDIASGMFAGHLLSMFSLHACRPLNQLIENMATYKLIMENYGQTVAVHHLMPTLQTALNLIGNGEQTSSLTGELMDEEYFENVQARDCFSALAMMKGSKLLLSCVFGEYDAALEIARDISNWTDSSFSLVFLSNAYLFSGIIFAAAAKARNQKGVSKVKNVLKLLKKAVRHSGGVYDSQVSILEAEVDALSGKWQSALVKYNQAIERASEEKLHMLTGIAHERVANLLISERLHSESMMHLASATEAFEAWEANAKVKQLSNRIASMRVIPPRG
jgi:predicted ATPase